MAISRNTKNLQLKVWGTNLPNTYGQEYLQSINGDIQNSSFKLIDDWAGTVNAIIGTSPFSTEAKTLTSAINELHTRTSSLEDNYIKDIKVNGKKLNKTDNNVNLTIPTKSSEIENDSHIDIETLDDEVKKDAISFGDTVQIVKEVVRDENGHVIQVKSINSTFPLISASEINVGNGNAVTSISVNNGVIRGLKEQTFLTENDFNNKEQLAKIGEDANGNFTYNGNVISGGSGETVKVKVDDRDIYVPTDGIITIPNYPRLCADGVVEGGQYYDFHVPGTSSDHDGRIYVDNTDENKIKIEDSIGKYAINEEIKNLKDKNLPKFYTKSITQINNNFTANTEISTVFKAMEDNSIAIYSVDASNTIYPSSSGLCKIIKCNLSRNSFEFTSCLGQKYYGVYHEETYGTDNGFSGWKLIPNIDREVVAFELAEGFTAISSTKSNHSVEKVGGWATLRCNFTKDSGMVTDNDVIGTIPSGYRPKYEISTLVRAIYVADVTSTTYDTMHMAQVIVRATGKVQLHRVCNSGSDTSNYNFNRAYITISYPVA